MVVEFFEVVVGGCRLLLMVLGGFRSFHVLVTTDTHGILTTVFIFYFAKLIFSGFFQFNFLWLQ